MPRVVTAMAFLAKEVSKIPLGQALEVFTSHQVATLPDLKGPFWMINSRILIYQVLLLEILTLPSKGTPPLTPPSYYFVQRFTFARKLST